ncbi:competence type IV pilus major pilin ComGC [Ornithinibacillus halotolerans]|uniref:ComG operon protein 3 n=1 Tax=Ornithinibacillus halotolerans TaxID=1274357 RepID=A0A916RVG7_9BACI|nr:competence type IV pilus major pilin ComGC [Ornithinibacillus halotolerans]GGA68305.1 hypothetical protein GCM10008025_10350 [Ornithinibacillus halotolerans]
MFRNEKGFTLIEMLVVMMVISIILLLVIPNLGEKNKKVQEDGCDALVAVVQAQVDTYYLENGTYPENLEVLLDEKYLRSEDQLSCSGKPLSLENGIVTDNGSTTN